MKPKMVRFGYLVSFGERRNCHLEVEAEVEKGETYEEAYAKLQKDVMEKVTKVAEEDARQYISKDLAELEAQRDTMQKEVQSLRDAHYFTEQIKQVQQSVSHLVVKLAEIQNPKAIKEVKIALIPSDAEEAAFDENDDGEEQ